MNWYKKENHKNFLEAKFNDYEEVWKRMKEELIQKGIDRDPTFDEVQKRMIQEEFSYENEYSTA